MKINNKSLLSSRYLEVCSNCQSKNIQLNDRKYYCLSCKQESDRSIIFDEKIKAKIDKEDNYIHFSAGILVAIDDKILVLERNKFPLGLTIPAGHVDNGESYEQAAIRELEEEAGVALGSKELKRFSRTPELIYPDSCRRGSDHHMWVLFGCKLSNGLSLKVDEKEASSYKLVDKETFMNTDDLLPTIKEIRSKFRSEINNWLK